MCAMALSTTEHQGGAELLKNSVNAKFAEFLKANFRESPECELRRIPILRTRVHKGLEPPSAGYMEPLWGRETLARQGANRMSETRMSEQDQKVVNNKNIPEWAQGLYYSSGRSS